MPFTMTMPKLSPTMEEGVIVKWHKKEGDFIADGELVLEVATDKATVDHSALDGGYLRKILIPEGGVAKINQPIAVLSTTLEEDLQTYLVELAKPSSAPASLQTERPFCVASTEDISQEKSRISASPFAKKVAKEKGIDLSTVQGSGPNRRIVSSDLETSSHYREESLSPMRKIIAERLQASKASIPHFYLSLKIRAEKLLEVREELKQTQLSVSINDLIVRAVALALREHPDINVGFDLQKQLLLHFTSIDIAIAVAMEDGLVTPIIRKADRKNIREIASETKFLVEKGRKGKLLPEEYTGGSFTISNLGMYGISAFTAIINPPQATILAVGTIEERAVIIEGQVVPGKEITLTLSVDHRVIDGAQAAQFLKTLQQHLENPISLAL